MIIFGDTKPPLDGTIAVIDRFSLVSYIIYVRLSISHFVSDKITSVQVELSISDVSKSVFIVMTSVSASSQETCRSDHC